MYLLNYKIKTKNIMKEFKGTKGNWEVTKDNNVFADGKIIFAHQSNFNNNERQANAKLIASALEMLEMLEIAKSEFGEYHFLYNAIDILIKKATE